MKNNEDVVALIKALTQSEKRYFKVFVAKNSIGESSHYLTLFDLIEKTGTTERKVIEKYCKDRNFMQKYFNAYKFLIYNQLLKSLRSYHSKKSMDDEIMELIREAKILYDKTLYLQAEKLLEKAKTIACKYENFSLLLEIMRWQKKIIKVSSLTQNKITERDINQLVEEEKAIIHKIDNATEYWKLSILMFLPYWLNGPCRTQEDVDRYNSLIDSPVLKNELLALSYNAKQDLYSIYSIYYIAIHNKKGNYEYCKKQLMLADAHPYQIKEDINKYSIILHNLLYATQRLKKYKEFFDLIPKLKSLCNDIKLGMSESLRHKVQLLACHLEFRAYIKTGQFKKATILLPEIEDILGEQENKDEGINLFILMNKAILYIGKGDHHNALSCINTIINNKNINVLQDIYSTAKMFQLLIHFEKGNMDLLPYLVKSVYRYLLQKKQLHKVESIFIRFVRTKLNEIKTTKDQIEAFKTLRKELDEICNDPIEEVYLEDSYLISLLECKIKNKPLEEILKEKSGFILDESIESGTL